MMQCKDCEFFQRGDDGEIAFACDPFTNVVEPECLAKWQLIKINQMVAGYQSTLRYYEKLAPMQEKMFRAMEREIDEMSESDKWKIHEDEDDRDDDRDDPESDDSW